MKMLTQKQIRKAAKTSRKEAVICSAIHWTQLARASKHVIKGVGEEYLKTDGCAMCQRYDLKGRGSTKACPPCRLACLAKGHWYKAFSAYTTRSGFSHRGKGFRWKRWQKAANVLRRDIMALLKKEYGIDGRLLRWRML